MRTTELAYKAKLEIKLQGWLEEILVSIQEISKFHKYICHRIFTICTRRCYANQVIIYRVEKVNGACSPQELACETTLLVRHHFNLQKRILY